jgi:hypothetical protein
MMRRLMIAAFGSGFGVGVADGSGREELRA